MLLAGCYQPELDGCKIACTTTCPGSLTCGSDGFCHAGAGEICASDAPDAAPPVNATITVEIDGDGTGLVDQMDGSFSCAMSSCQLIAPVGSQVTLEAVPDSSKRFARWTGTCPAPISTTCPFTVVGDATIEATFWGNTVQLSPPSLTMVEGDRKILLVALANPPASEVMVDVSAELPAMLSVSPDVLPIGVFDFAAPHPVTITALADANSVEDTSGVGLALPDSGDSEPVTIIDLDQLQSIGWPTALGDLKTESTGTIIAYPIHVAADSNLARVGVLGAVQGGVGEMAVYAGTSASPGNLFATTVGNFGIDVGDNHIDMGEVPLPAGDYWIALRVDSDVELDDGTTTIAMRCTGSSAFGSAWPDPFPIQSCIGSATLNVYAQIYP